MKRLIILMLILSNLESLQAQPIEGAIRFSLFDGKTEMNFPRTKNDSLPASEWFREELVDSLGMYSVKLFRVQAQQSQFEPYRSLYISREPYVEFSTWPGESYMLVVTSKRTGKSMQVTFSGVGTRDYGLDILFIPGEFHLAQDTLDNATAASMQVKYGGVDITPYKWKKKKRK